MKTGVEIIANERQLNQIEKHGFTGKHHAENPQWYDREQLVSAAHMISAYNPECGTDSIYREFCPFNWDLDWWQKLCDEPKERRLAIAGAFIASEIDRINYLKLHKNDN